MQLYFQGPSRDGIIQVDGTVVAQDFACLFDSGGHKVEIVCTILTGIKSIDVHLYVEHYSFTMPTGMELLRNNPTVVLSLRGYEANYKVKFHLEFTHSIRNDTWSVNGNLNNSRVVRESANPFDILSMLGNVIQKL